MAKQERLRNMSLIFVSGIVLSIFLTLFLGLLFILSLCFDTGLFIGWLICYVFTESPEINSQSEVKRK